jgi:hypothetical protein
LNRPSQEVLTDLEQVSGELGQDDTLLFYYSCHGKLRGNELCLVSNETIVTSLGATSIRARLVLQYLQESLARRRILILDCCHSGAISSIYKAVDSKSSLEGLANSFGSYILTASTSIELAEEREKDGHGVFTKALIDCLREGPKERITISDLYEYAHSRLKISAQQTPLFWALQQVGPALEIGNYQAKHERERREAFRQLLASAGIKLGKFTTGIHIRVHAGSDDAFIAWSSEFIPDCRGFALRRRIKRGPNSALSPNTKGEPDDQGFAEEIVASWVCPKAHKSRRLFGRSRNICGRISRSAPATAAARIICYPCATRPIRGALKLH